MGRNEFTFKQGHGVPQEWKDKTSKINKGKHYSPETEFKPDLPRLDKQKVSDAPLIRYYQQNNYPIKKMCRLLNMAKSSIATRLQRLGLKLENEGKFQKNHKRRITHGHNYLIKLYKKLHPFCEVCDWKFGLDIHHIIS